MKLIALSIIGLASSVDAFVATYPCRSSSQLALSVNCPAVAEGEREIVDGDNGPILVTKVAGSYYAVDATCPHLGLPMKKGKISNEGGTPTLICNFHNSCFELSTGKCTKWVTGALGFQSGLISGIMNKVGSEQKDITSYYVTEMEDGSLIVNSDAPVAG